MGTKRHAKKLAGHSISAAEKESTSPAARLPVEKQKTPPPPAPPPPISAPKPAVHAPTGPPLPVKAKPDPKPKTPPPALPSASDEDSEEEEAESESEGSEDISARANRNAPLKRDRQPDTNSEEDSSDDSGGSRSGIDPPAARRPSPVKSISMDGPPSKPRPPPSPSASKRKRKEPDTGKLDQNGETKKRKSRGGGSLGSKGGKICVVKEHLKTKDGGTGNQNGTPPQSSWKSSANDSEAVQLPPKINEEKSGHIENDDPLLMHITGMLAKEHLLDINTTPTKFSWDHIGRSKIAEFNAKHAKYMLSSVNLQMQWLEIRKEALKLYSEGLKKPPIVGS